MGEIGKGKRHGEIGMIHDYTEKPTFLFEEIEGRSLILFFTYPPTEQKSIKDLHSSS